MGCPQAAQSGSGAVAIAGSDAWAPQTYALDNVTSVRIAVNNDQRRSVLVVNDSASAGSCHVLDKAWTGASVPAVGSRAYPLAPGEGVTVSTTAEVYAIADTGAGATLKVIEEFGG